MNPIEQGYIVVAERHAAFVKDHPEGRVNSEVENFIFDPATGKGFVTVRCEVWRGPLVGEPDGVGNASMPIPGPTNFTRNSEVENAETSALGRALAMIGYHPKATMASEDEIKAKGSTDSINLTPIPVPKAPDLSKLTASQRARIFSLADEAKISKDALGIMRLNLTKKHNSAQMSANDGETLINALRTHIAEIEAVEKTTGGKRVPVVTA